MINAETKYLDDMDNAHEAFIDSFYESMGNLAYAQNVRKKAERKAEYAYQQRKGDIMTDKEIDELFSPVLQMLEDFLEKEGSLALLTDSEYREMNAIYNYYEKLCLSVKLRNSEIAKAEQKPATLPLYNDKDEDEDEGADIYMKKKHSKDMKMC